MDRRSLTAYADGVLEALATIRAQPLRASLSALAMAAAVATTAVVQTGLDGLARAARETSARAFGSDTFVLARISPGNLSRRELADKLERNPPITRADGRFLEGVADGRVAYAVTAQKSADVIAGGRKFENATVNGTQAALLDIRNIEVERGRFFANDEDVRGAQLIVAGRAIVDALFPAADPLGQSVRIAGRGFRIIGIQTLQGTAGGVSLDRYIWMPMRAYERAFGAPPSLQVFAKATDLQRSVAAEDHARISMRARRHLGPSAPDTFDIITPEASRSFVTAITGRIGAAGPPISLMALIAAIVVVTNTTLASVTQRTREIGIRRAVGAARVNVLVETLAESGIVGLIGGGIGLLVATGLLSSATRVLGVDVTLSWTTAIGSIVAAGLAGVVAGWYPARRAASLDVINALRTE